MEARFLAASATLAAVRDVVDERATGTTPPSWCVRRGWDEFLAQLSDEDVIAAERVGLARYLEEPRGAPPELVALTGEIQQSTRFPIATVTGETAAPTARASPRKRAQIAAFASLARGLGAGATRIVDVGSGHGHLTRHLASALGVSAEGWESDAARVAVARSLTAAHGPSFLELDARTAGDALLASDLVVGLHACGELGDHAVRAAARAGSAVALVGCCLQKRAGDRAPLVVPRGIDPHALVLGRAVLGLGNARDGEVGVEADLATRSASRRNRVALALLLASAGLSLEPGEEMRGVNRRRATGTLDELVTRVFEVRGLAARSPAAVVEAARAGSVLHARQRRWELPRTMIARLIEVWVALDRAMYLEQAGGRAEVVLAFDERESPRNIAVLAARS